MGDIKINSKKEEWVNTKWPSLKEKKKKKE